MTQAAILPATVRADTDDLRFKSLKEKGFRAIYAEEWSFPGERYFIWNQPQEEYAQEVINAFTIAPDIVLARGGTGTQETIYYLHKHFRPQIEEIAKRAREGTYHPPAFLGFSDAVHLMTYLGGMGIARPYMLNSKGDDSKTIAEIQKVTTAEASTTQNLDLLQINPSARGITQGVPTSVSNFEHGFSSFFSHFIDENHANILFAEQPSMEKTQKMQLACIKH